jgi:hypothetical protein
LLLLLLPPWLLLQMGCGDGLPAEVTEEMLQDDSFLQTFHHALLEVRAAQCRHGMTSAILTRVVVSRTGLATD